MNIAKCSWDRLKGQTDWKNGKPGGALIHTPCGGNPIYAKEQVRSLWEEGGPGPCAGHGNTVIVAELYCVKCHAEPTTKPGAPIYPSQFFNPETQSAQQNSHLIDLVEGAAKFRGDQVIPRDFIAEALERVGNNQETVERYPLGKPSLKGVYEIASRLHKESAAQPA